MLLILFIENTFKLFLCKSIYINDIIILKNKLYKIDSTSKSNEGFIGFFDWLRKNDKTIVGIRLNFFDYLNYCNVLITKSFVKYVFENRSIELMFKGEYFNFDLSGDQDFTNNFVYESEDGEYVFTFGLDHLTEDELKSLQEYCEVITEEELGSC
ncbi:hypothetical protein COR50_20635 [Chitinophaga caeni]|uniref:Uncharacterized protein n=1 Tax=Chitinophaga caeni TaxID=2029983 RepID=A0A291QZD8_9BACT|nr:hypothetical protein [Chitinophaga caeni]ATL49389.1 hypothetical protein COR50_20635 [Chitinophaga caeni]